MMSDGAETERDVLERLNSPDEVKQATALKEIVHTAQGFSCVEFDWHAQDWVKAGMVKPLVSIIRARSSSSSGHDENVLSSLKILSWLSIPEANSISLIGSGLPTQLVAVMGLNLPEYTPLVRKIMQNLDKMGARLRGEGPESGNDSSIILKALNSRPKRLKIKREVKQELKALEQKKQETQAAVDDTRKIAKAEEFEKLRRSWRQAALERHNKEADKKNKQKEGQKRRTRRVNTTKS